MANQNAEAPVPARPHALTLENRKTLSLTGVKEVTAFDEKQLALQTEGGPLIIDGSDLHVTTLLLEEGRVAISGQINALTYTGRGGSRRGLGALLGG